MASKVINGKGTGLLSTATFLLSFISASAFDRDMTAQEFAIIRGETFVRDLVIGDKAYMRGFFLCWDEDRLSILSSATIEPLEKVSWTDVSYTFLVQPSVGGKYDLSTLADRVKKPEPDSIEAQFADSWADDWAGKMGETLVQRSYCEDYLARDPSLTLLPVGKVDGFDSFSKWLQAMMKVAAE